MADLLAHLGRVYDRLIGMLADGAPFVTLTDWRPTPTGPAAVPWFHERAATLVELFGRTDPEQPSTFMTGPTTARTWFRRMAQETSIHRVDAQQALGGTVDPISADLAVDGIDEVLTVFAPRLPAARWAAVAGGDRPATIHLHCTDAEGEWMLRLGAEGLTVTREHAKGDVAARGGAGAIDQVLWNRLPASALERFGDDALLDGFLATARF